MSSVIPKECHKGHWELHAEEDGTGLLTPQITVQKLKRTTHLYKDKRQQA